jgi:hypothetical protein
MSKARTPLILGIAAAGGVGYYLYNAGGNAKAAEKQFESKFSFPFLPVLESRPPSPFSSSLSSS